MGRRTIGALATAACAAVWLLLLWPTSDAESARRETKLVPAKANVPGGAQVAQRAPDPPEPSPATLRAPRAAVENPVQQSARARAFASEAPNEERSASVSAMITQFLMPRSEDAPSDDGVLIAVDCRETSCRISTRADDAGQALLTKLAALSSVLEIAEKHGDEVGQLTAYVALPAAPLDVAH